MMRDYRLGASTLLLAFLFAGAGFAIAAPIPSREKLGAKIDLPTLITTSGKQIDLSNNKPIVVAFLSFECPVACDYITTLSKLTTEFATKGITVVGFIPTDETAVEVSKKGREFQTTFPILSDAKHHAVTAFQAGHTPEVFVLDAQGSLRYRGRIDDKYGARLKPNAKITRHDLREALDEVLAGKPVSVPTTLPIGCPIQELDRPVQPTGKVTYYRDVLPILQNRCQECHRPGEVGPFSLMTYKQAVTWAADIKEYTDSRKMPPWKASAGVKFQHDRRMPDAEIKILAAWADGGTPEGKRNDAPPPKKFTQGWSLGEPDLILEMDTAMQLAANGPDHFRCVVLPTGLTEDKFVIGYEVRPGNQKVLHHSVNYFDTTGTARRMARTAQAAKPTGEDRGPGYESPMGIGFTPDDPLAIGNLGGWTPGTRGVKLHSGTGILLPRGADVVLQLHYHRSGKAETDRTRVGLYFAKKDTNLKIQQLVVVPGLVSPTDNFRPFAIIPAGASAFRVIGKVVVENDCELYGCLPHMHMLGKNIKVTMTPQQRAEQTLVAIDDWDYNWQEGYQFATPVTVKAGTILTVEATFDNSAKNPHNPASPPRDVKKGDGTTDEMLFGFLTGSPKEPGKIKLRPLMEKTDYQPHK